MLRILSFLDEAAGKELILPVTPSSYQWSHGNRVETIRLDQLGEINLPGGRQMGSCTLTDLLLPAQLYPFCNPGASANPFVYIEQLETWSDANKVVRFLVSNTPLNAQVLIESVEYGERDGTNDVYATVSLRQYRKPEVPVLAVTGGGADTGRDTATGAAQTRTYTIVKGDTLWGIAQKFYGSGAYYTRLAAANSAVIKNPNLIYPGQVLTIPPVDQLPAAMTASASVKTANNTKTTRTTTTATATTSSTTDRSQDKRWKVQLAKEQALARR